MIGKERWVAVLALALTGARIKDCSFDQNGFILGNLLLLALGCLLL